MNKLLVVLCFLMPHICFAQAENTRYFKGRIDDFNDIRITLNCQDKDCAGELKYLRSETTFQLKGNLYGENLELKEIDAAGNISGKIVGKIVNKKLHAQWSNFDKSIGSKMVLEETTVSDDVPTYCGENKAIIQYISKNGDESIKLLMQAGANGQLLGTADWGGQLYQLQGETEADNSFSARLKSSNGQIYQLLSDYYQPSRTLRASLVDRNNRVRSLTFKVRDQIDVGCVRYADYATSYDATYPQTKDEAFDDWIENIIFSWADSCKNFAKIQQNLPFDPKNRAVHRATAWVDLTYYSKEFITGFVIFNNNWEAQPRCLSFNFDLKQGICLIKNDLFKNIFDLPIFTKKAAINFFRNHPQYNDLDFRDWIENAEFPHFTIQKDGINFSTDFDLIYGQQSMLIPYIELAHFLQPNTLSDRELD